MPRAGCNRLSLLPARDRGVKSPPESQISEGW